MVDAWWLFPLHFYERLSIPCSCYRIRISWRMIELEKCLFQVANVQILSLLFLVFSSSFTEALVPATAARLTTIPDVEVDPVPNWLVAVHWLVSCNACDVRRSISEISCSVSGSRQGSLPWRLTRSLLSIYKQTLGKFLI